MSFKAYQLETDFVGKVLRGLAKAIFRLKGILKPQALGELPEATARIAKAAFPKGNTIMRLRDEFDGLFKDEGFSELRDL